MQGLGVAIPNLVRSESAAPAEAGWGAGELGPPPAQMDALFTWPWRGRGVASGAAVSESDSGPGGELLAPVSPLLGLAGAPAPLYSINTEYTST